MVIPRVYGGKYLIDSWNKNVYYITGFMDGIIRHSYTEKELVSFDKYLAHNILQTNICIKVRFKKIKILFDLLNVFYDGFIDNQHVVREIKI